MAVRIGIPRALHFFQHYPHWRTFFEDLGAEIVISPPTNRDLVAAGAKIVADVTCLPIAVYAGHVVWLRDQANADFVFVPAIRNLVNGAFHCAKFQALPDILKSTVPDCPPLLDIEIDLERRKISESQAFHRLGRDFTWNPLKIDRAWAHACEVDRAYREMMVSRQLTYPQALGQLYGGEWETDLPPAPSSALTVGVVGHPYNLYDTYINHDLITRLRDLGVRVATSEMVSPQDALAGVQRTTGQTLWFYENAMSGAAGHYLLSPQVDGVIAVLAFTCGPDSAMVETLTRRAHALQRSFMGLVLDQHGSAVGMVTRLEAFVDMLTRQKKVSPAPEAARTPGPAPRQRVAAPAVLTEIHKPVLGFPRMGTTVIPLKSLFRGIGARLELGPPLSSHTVALGVRHSPEFICTPYKYILGNMIEMLERGADTLLYVDGPGLCRNSAYTQLLNDILHDLGYDFTFLTTAILEDKVVGLAKFLRQFSPDVSWGVILRELRLGIAKMRALDEIERRVQTVRPRELTQGGVDKLWDEAMARVDDVTEYEALRPAKADALRKIDATPIDPEKRPVKIATTGEYFAVLDPFFNLDLERELGRLGAEVHRTLMMSDWVQGALILEALGFPRKPEIDRAAKPYLRWDISGEGWVTIGQTVIHAHKGFDGMVETMPFTCLPESVALNILPRVSREHNIPVLTFIFDEQSGRAGMKTRLEAFVDLLYRRRAVKAAAQKAEPPGEAAQALAGAEACAACPITATCPQVGQGLAVTPDRSAYDSARVKSGKTCQVWR
ncbi:MAG: hypothetical protein HZB20_01005, partial [Chloroflexi bacterium]|nr:hypothetical protein [Chloroflexota bacterium]